MMAGSVSAAEQILEVPPTWFTLPEHLRVILVIEQGSWPAWPVTRIPRPLPPSWSRSAPAARPSC